MKPSEVILKILAGIGFPILVAFAYCGWIVLIGLAVGFVNWDLSIIPDNIVPWDTEHVNGAIRGFATAFSLFGVIGLYAIYADIEEIG